MTALTLAPEHPTTAGSRARWGVADALTIARRNLTHVRNMPEKLMDVTIQPVLFTVLFTYIFGGAIDIPGSSYKEFLAAGIFVQTLAFTAAGTAVSVADDMHKGVIDRFRVLPIARSAVLAGQTTADLVASVLGLTILAITATLVGWRIHEGIPSALAGFAIILLFGYAMTWAGTLVGLSVRAPDVAQQVMFLVMFPLTFVANTFVPTASMPTWLQTFADWNPISAVTAAARELFGNSAGQVPSDAWPMQHPIPAALIYSVLILAVVIPLSVRRYRRAASR
jgi:ABC-2 type transport system permease protein